MLHYRVVMLLCFVDRRNKYCHYHGHHHCHLHFHGGTSSGLQSQELRLHLAENIAEAPLGIAASALVLWRPAAARTICAARHCTETDHNQRTLVGVQPLSRTKTGCGVQHDLVQIGVARECCCLNTIAGGGKSVWTLRSCVVYPTKFHLLRLVLVTNHTCWTKHLRDRNNWSSADS